MNRFIVCSFLGDFSPDVLNLSRPTQPNSWSSPSSSGGGSKCDTEAGSFSLFVRKWQSEKAEERSKEKEVQAVSAKINRFSGEEAGFWSEMCRISKAFLSG
jgi:hypothetical protein